MTYRNLKKLMDEMNDEQLDQDVAIAIIDDDNEFEVYQKDVGFVNPIIPVGPLLDDVEDCILDADHCYFVLII